MDIPQDTFSDQFLIGTARDPIRNQGLHELLLADSKSDREDKLLRNGPPRQLSREEAIDLRNPRRALSFVAIDLTSGATVCHLSMHRKTTLLEGGSAGVDLVVTHPEFTGKRVALRVMICAILNVQRSWKPLRSVTLTSNERRVAARTMYEKLGFQLRGIDRFILELDPDPNVRWTPPGIVPDCIASLDQKVIYGWQPRSNNLRDAILLACKGDRWKVPGVPWNINPIGLYRYYQRPS